MAKIVENFENPKTPSEKKDGETNDSEKLANVKSTRLHVDAADDLGDAADTARRIAWEDGRKRRRGGGAWGEDEGRGDKGCTSGEIAKKYPHRMDNQTIDDEKSKKGQQTQVATTVGTYKRVGELIGKNIGKVMSEMEAKSFVQRMQESAETADEIELTPDNWIELFGKGGIVSTPIGEVKMGENQYFKLSQQGRKIRNGQTNLGKS